MFGLGFSEMVVIGIVLLVVVGPRELPKLLRAVGGGLSKLREMSADLRDQSGIDDIIQDENLREDLDTIRSLSRGNVMNNLMREATKAPRRPRPVRKSAPLPEADLSPPDGSPPDADMEYPEVGCDAYEADDDDAPPSHTGLHHEADVSSQAYVGGVAEVDTAAEDTAAEPMRTPAGNVGAPANVEEAS